MRGRVDIKSFERNKKFIHDYLLIRKTKSGIEKKKHPHDLTLIDQNCYSTINLRLNFAPTQLSLELHDTVFQVN